MLRFAAFALALIWWWPDKRNADPVPVERKDPDGLTPSARWVFDRWQPAARAIAEQNGFRLDVIETLRSASRQVELIASGASKIDTANADHAPHVEGRAWDFVLRLVVGGSVAAPSLVVAWYDPDDPKSVDAYRRIGAMAKAYGARWGGDFNPRDKHGIGWDPGHVEVPTSWTA